MNTLGFIITNILSVPYIVFGLGFFYDAVSFFLPNKVADRLTSTFNIDIGTDNLLILVLTLLMIYWIVFSFKLINRIKQSTVKKKIEKRIIVIFIAVYIILISMVLIGLLLELIIAQSMASFSM